MRARVEKTSLASIAQRGHRAGVARPFQAELNRRGMSPAGVAAAVSPVAVALDQAGVTVTELTLRTPTLDDVFLELTGDRIEVSAG